MIYLFFLFGRSFHSFKEQNCTKQNINASSCAIINESILTNTIQIVYLTILHQSLIGNLLFVRCCLLFLFSSPVVPHFTRTLESHHGIVFGTADKLNDIVRSNDSHNCDTDTGGDMATEERSLLDPDK